MHISIVSPFYNEEAMVFLFLQRLAKVTRSLKRYNFETICVNDGSNDHTLERLLAVQKKDVRLKIIDLSRHFGKESALTAGIDAACGKAVIIIDSDLQHPPELISAMLKKWRSGFEVVLAKRIERKADGFLKRFTADLFYGMYKLISNYKIPENVGDFRLIDRIVVDALKKLPERRRFMKGLFAWVGFNSTTVDYVCEKRYAGKTKFNIWRLWNFAIEGITSFSSVPLRVWTYVGLTASLLALLYAIYIVLRTMVLGVDLPGYASLLVAILFMGGVQLIGIGVLGEYIGRIYDETKQRPIYLIKKVYAVNR